jgi:hypothetical protein
MTNPHEYEVNSNKSGSLTDFEFKKWSKSKNKIFFLKLFYQGFQKNLDFKFSDRFRSKRLWITF